MSGNKKKQLKRFAYALVAAIATVWVTTICLQVCWNRLIPDVFGLPAITGDQAFTLFLLIFFGGFILNMTPKDLSFLLKRNGDEEEQE